MALIHDEIGDLLDDINACSSNVYTPPPPPTLHKSSTAPSLLLPARSNSQDKKKRKPNSVEEEESSKPYECRFCPMRFSKSQALGGHMNRHRQERDQEQLINAGYLVMQKGFCPSVLPTSNCFSKLYESNSYPMMDNLCSNHLDYANDVLLAPRKVKSYESLFNKSLRSITLDEMVQPIQLEDKSRLNFHGDSTNYKVLPNIPCNIGQGILLGACGGKSIHANNNIPRCLEGLKAQEAGMGRSEAGLLTTRLSPSKVEYPFEGDVDIHVTNGFQQDEAFHLASSYDSVLSSISI